MDVLAEALVLTVGAIRHELKGHSTDFAFTLQLVGRILQRVSDAEKAALADAASRLAETERAVDGSDDNPWQVVLDRWMQDVFGR
jgi:hypothetical protein